MKETTKLILETLEKINDYFSGFESTDNPKYDYVRCTVSHRNLSEWYLSLDFETREFFYINSKFESRINSNGKEEYYTSHREYWLKYTDLEKENFDEDLYSDFLYASQRLIQGWDSVKRVFLNRYEKNKKEAESFENTLINFKA